MYVHTYVRTYMNPKDIRALSASSGFWEHSPDCFDLLNEGVYVSLSADAVASECGQL